MRPFPARVFTFGCSSHYTRDILKATCAPHICQFKSFGVLFYVLAVRLIFILYEVLRF